jgi:aminoglycoside phosphotransferase (APT) family kinase protein
MPGSAPVTKMHAGEREIDAALVRRLLAAQLPQWADLPLARVRSDGTDNVIYRLGDDLAVRVPRYAAAAAQAEKEAEWLPRLAPHLSLVVPVPVALGAPGEGFPWHWSVCRWVPGEPATLERIADPTESAVQLAGFVAALQRIDPAGGPPPGEHNFGRGEPLAHRDEEVRAALEQLHDSIDVGAAAAVWEAALAAPAWDRPGVWIHGDLHGGNLLATGGRLSGLVDFGGLGVGDPACDVMVARTFLPRSARAAFRAELDVDDATWARARGWALSMGLIALPYYRKTNPALARSARRWIEEALGDAGG